MNHHTGSTNERRPQGSEYPAVMPHILQRLTKVDTQLEFLVKNTATKGDIANLRNWVLGSVGGGIISLLAVCWLATL